MSNWSERLKQVCILSARLVLAIAFLFSGITKAVDPWGTAFKIQDYLIHFGLNQLVPFWLYPYMAMALAGLEFYVGLCLMWGIRRYFTALVSLAIMLVMTPLTLWLAIANPIADCGCFGDALVLSNWATFGKNVFLLLCVLLLWRGRRLATRFISENTQWLISVYGLLFVLLLMGHCMYHLPIADFRPYRIGNNITEQMEIPEGETAPEFDTRFVMEKDGKQQEFTLDNYPDSTWQFVDSYTVQTSEGYVPPVHDFILERVSDGEDITDQVLTDEGYTFLLVAYDLTKAQQGTVDLVNELYDYCNAYGYTFYGVTASGDEAIEQWRYDTGAAYDFCRMDAIPLKTMVRSNPGIVLLKEGTVINKWGSNDFPTEEYFRKPLEQTTLVDTDGSAPYGTLWKVVVFLLAVPLGLITLLDRVWTGLLLIGKLRKKSKISNLLKKKKMRKKIVAGNWKMNKNLQEGVALATELKEVLAADAPNCGVVIGTPFIHLATVAELLKDSVIAVSAENCANKEKGAYTGEVSAEMVKSTGAEYVILGHSERREYYNETPEILKEKVDLALANGLKVIFCIGESLAQREANEQEAVCKAELAGSVFHLTAEQWKNIVIAYEPIWAIGTGKTATAEQAEEIHAYIRSCVAEVYGAEAADDTTILYGGSCKASNAPELFAKADIDGGLIGGASLKAADFKGIIDAFK
ncbi:MAG: triose-phosphate isomerase [Bacteroidaceae bacterium]|nr:triose-phosphate isomerase [Bacteroidaceae bacterium]